VVSDHRYPQLHANEWSTLDQFLDGYRRNVLGRLDRVTDVQASARLLAGTGMTIGGIVKHLAHMEDLWFTHKLLGRDLPEPWASAPPGDEDWDFHSAAADPVGSLRELYRAACDRSRAAAAGFADLDRRAALISFGKAPVSLRWLLVHMISETAQHSGHLDLLMDAVPR
jgi:uncharacterized damage-inducible protein DinB